MPRPSRAVQMMMGWGYRKVANKGKEMEQYDQKKQGLFEAAKRIKKACPHTGDTNMPTLMFHINLWGEAEVLKVAEQNLSGYLFRRTLTNKLNKQNEIAKTYADKDKDQANGENATSTNG